MRLFVFGYGFHFYKRQTYFSCALLLIPILFFLHFLVFHSFNLMCCWTNLFSRLNLMHSFHGLSSPIYCTTKRNGSKKCKCNRKTKRTPYFISFLFRFFVLNCQLFQPSVVIEYWKMAFQPPLITIIWMLNGVIKATNENIIHKWRGKSKLLAHSSMHIAHTHTCPTWVHIVIMCVQVINSYAYIFNFPNCTERAYKYLNNNAQTWTWNTWKLAHFARFSNETERIQCRYCVWLNPKTVTKYWIWTSTNRHAKVEQKIQQRSEQKQLARELQTKTNKQKSAHQKWKIINI